MGLRERRPVITQAVDKAGRNLDRDDGLTNAFEASPFCLAVVMSRPTEDRAIGDAS